MRFAGSFRNVCGEGMNWEIIIIILFPSAKTSPLGRYTDVRHGWAYCAERASDISTPNDSILRLLHRCDRSIAF